MLNRTIAPPIREAVDYHLSLKPCTHYTLDNGVPVYAVDGGTQDLLQIEMVYDAGNFFETGRTVAAATNHLLKNGTSTRNAFQINEAFEYYGAYANRSCFNETATVSLHTLSRHLDPLLPLLREMVTDSQFPQDELDIYRQNTIQRLQVNLRKGDFVATRLIDSYVYGEQHPYGTYTLREDLEALEVGALRRFYEQHYLNGSLRLFVAGRLPKDLPASLNRHFGSLPVKGSPSPLPEIARTPSARRVHRVTNDPQAVQGAIRLAAPFPSRHHPDFRKAQVLNMVFGGYFGSRLMSNIREDKGYTYGIYSYLQNHQQDTAWLIGTEAGKDVCEATLTEIYAEMKRLREEPVSDGELQLVRNYLIGGMLGELDGPFHLLSKWKQLILNGLDESYFQQTVQDIKTVTPAELQALAQTYLQPERFYELVVY